MASSDYIGRMLEAFRTGQAIRTQRESLRLREEDAAREADRMDTERQIAELTTKLKLQDMFSKTSRGGAASIPASASQAGVLVPGAPVAQIPNEILLNALPKLGINAPMSLPVQSADDVMELAVQEARRKAEATARGKQAGEEMVLSDVVRDLVTRRNAQAGVKTPVPTRMAPDELKALTSLTSQFPELTTILGSIPGVAKQGEEISTAELSARIRALENEGATARTAANIAAAKDRRSTMTPAQELSTINTLSSGYKRFTAGAREAVRYYGMMDETVRGIESGQITDLNAATQAIINSFNRVIEPGSVTRETEYARSPEGQALLDQMLGKLESLQKGGPGLRVQSLRTFVDLTKKYTDQAIKSTQGETDRIKKLAKEYGLDEGLITGGLTLSMPGEAPTTQTPQGAGGGGARKQFRNKKTGALEWFTIKNGQWVKE